MKKNKNIKDNNEDLVLKAKENNQEAVCELWKSVTRMARKLAYRFGRDCGLVEDCLSEAKIGFYEALQRFDPKKGMSFSSWAYLWMKVRIARMKQHLVRQEEYSYDAVEFKDSDDDNELSFKELVVGSGFQEQDPYEIVWKKKMMQDMVNERMKLLSKKERKLIKQRFFDDLGLEEIGELNGMSAQLVWWHIKNALLKMRHYSFKK